MWKAFMELSCDRVKHKIATKFMSFQSLHPLYRAPRTGMVEGQLGDNHIVHLPGI